MRDRLFRLRSMELRVGVNSKAEVMGSQSRLLTFKGCYNKQCWCVKKATQNVNRGFEMA